MKTFRILVVYALCIVVIYLPLQINAAPDSGFFLPDNLNEVTFQYKTYRNLIVLPVTINDSIQVNLILDTGCRNLVLFGKQFQNQFKTEAGRKIQFSGLGSGQPVYGSLSLSNNITINKVIGARIPIVIVPERNVFEKANKIDGVIGYDIFIKFEVELNPKEKLITFRPAYSPSLALEYLHIPIRIEDSRPVLQSHISIEKNSFPCNLMIDTGSSLGLLLKTTDESKFDGHTNLEELGRGFNGVINGFKTRAKRLELDGLSFGSLQVGIIQSPWHECASIGMDVLKGYSIVLNYCKEYIGFRKNA
ncbi:MAG TPA: aspartyl protease family protein [Chryseolinea sp.]|nr:aspartyl protease family protein [Chryseolinea sp.]HPH46920.1 aspartyl protease family protein [Chryseolinea sp.]HPM31088.1 aspartyl protease family protein [Chryseolinea sp.]